jgi:hypothetical protein
MRCTGIVHHPEFSNESRPSQSRDRGRSATKHAFTTIRSRMSKFACTCGHVISDVQCPNEVTGWLLSDKSGESFFTTIHQTIDDYLQHAEKDDIAGWRRKHFNDIYPSDISAGSMIHDVLTSRFFDLTLATMECEQCGRIWVQRTPDMNHYHGYSPDDNDDSRIKLLGYNEASGPTSTEEGGRTKP